MRVVTLRLDIDGQAYFCKTYQNEAIQISRRVTDLENLASQRTITEKTFRVPLTDELIDALGLISDFTQDAKVNLNKAIEGQVLVNDYPYFTGSFQVFAVYTNLRETLKEVELVFKGNEVSLKQSLEELTMADILEGETYPYSAQQIKDFITSPQSYVDTNGRFFPLVDYGQRFTSSQTPSSETTSLNFLNQLDIKSAVTFKKLFELMPFDITWDSSIDDLVENQGILLHNNESRVMETDTSPKNYSGFLSRFNNNIQTLVFQTGQKVDFNNKQVYNIDNFNLANNTYEVPITGRYDLSLNGTFQVTALAGSATQTYFLKFYVSTNATFSNFKDIAVALTSPLAAGESQTFSVNVQKSFTLTAGDFVSLYVIYDKFSGSQPNIDVQFNTGFKFEVLTAPAVFGTSLVNMSANAPELNGWEIFSTIAKQCNAIIEQDDLGTYNIIPWQKWIDNLDVNRFLDDKIDDNKTIKITPFSIKGAKSIELSYLANDDLYSQAFLANQGLPYGSFKIKDTGTDATKKELKIEVPLSLPPPSYIPESSFPIIKLYDDELELIKGKPVLVQFYGDNSKIDINISIQDATIFFSADNYTSYPFTGHWSVLAGNIGGYGAKNYGFGNSLTYFAAQGYPNNTLHERFWKQYIQETYSEKARQIEMAIDDNIISVEETKFNERYYFKGNQFRLTEFDNYTLTSSEPFKVKLMKRITIENIDIAPFFPYDVIDGVVQWKDSATNTALSPPDGSGANQTNLEASAKAYGFFYDSNNDVAVQRGGILTLQ